MSTRFVTKVADLTIPQNESASEIIQLDVDAEGYLIYSPTELESDPAFTFKIQSAPLEQAISTDTFYDLYDQDGRLVSLAPEGCVKFFHLPFGNSWKIKSTDNVGADRVFSVYKVYSGC
jgi:hypothetical protein